MLKLPEAFEAQMKASLGAAYDTFVASLQTPSPTSIRVNPAKLQQLELPRIPWTQTGYYLPERPVFTLDPWHHAGAYYVQEASSMFIEQAFLQHVELAKPLRVLDLSAAPGGKSTHILSLLNNDSLLVSNEVIRSRASILAENLTKWGKSNSLVTNNDPSDFERTPAFFDVVVVDAPCSGEGLFRKDPEAVNEWSPENVALCASRQKRIFVDIWPALKPNGLLVYSTCTYNRLENEDNLKWLEQNQQIEFLTIKTEPSWGVVEVTEDKIKGYRFFPHQVNGEGFFVSVMRKLEESPDAQRRIKPRLTPLAARTVDKIKDWMNNEVDLSYFQHQDFIYMMPSAIANDVDMLIQQLKFVQAGTTIASVKHDKIIPEHAAATSVDLNKDSFEIIELTYEQAIQYLRRETFPLELNSKGYQLVTYKDVALGWINSLGNRFNNLYPIDWRIRMSSDARATSVANIRKS